MDISFEPLPLVIGVTGHRDLRERDIPLLKAEVAEVFDRLDQDYANRPSLFERMLRLARGAPSRRVMPIVVLSSLAEGADQLAAEVALERGLRVIAPLPLPVEEYRRDFELYPVRPDALRIFDALIQHPGVQTLFVGYEEGNSPENVHPLGDKRDLQYRRAGAFIARHCNVLIALWDGQSGTGVGGTAEIVGFKRSGIPLDDHQQSN
jgi:hypothetical protein